MPTLKIQRVHPDAIVPTYAHPGDAGMDLYAVERVVIKPKQMAPVPTGLSCQLPRGTVGLFWDKSGLATKHGLKIMGGVIDEGYRGELVVWLMNLGAKPVVFERGHKITQMLIQPVHRPRIVVANALTSSRRGTGGFGSTGK
jgi:dUTP pyrophosphatase